MGHRLQILGVGDCWVRACRLVALALPDPGSAIGSRLLIHPGSDRKQRVDHPIRFPGLPTHPALLWEGRLKFLYGPTRSLANSWAVVPIVTLRSFRAGNG